MSYTWNKTYSWNLHAYSSYHYTKSYNKVSVIRTLIIRTAYNSIVFLCPYKVFLRQLFIIRTFPSSNNYLHPLTDQISESSMHWKHIFVAEVHEDQSLIVYGASLFYWTWISKLTYFKIDVIFFRKNPPFWKHIFCIRSSWRRKLNYLWCFFFYRTWKSCLIPKL